MPGDRVVFYLEAKDNNGVSGPSVTRTENRTLRAPSLSELYADGREREDAQKQNMDDILEEGREIKERISELSEEIRAEGEMDWSRRSEAGDLLEQQKQLQEKLNEAAGRLDETLESLEANRMTSAEVGEKLEQIQSLIKKIESEELRDAMEKLRSMMEEADPDQVAAAMQDIEMTTERLMESLDRTIELLERLLDEQKVEEMMRRMEEMLAEQRELRDSTLAGGDEETADDQEELGDEYSEFEKDLGEFSEQSEESRTPGMDEMAEQAASSGVDSLMKKAAGDIREGEIEGASSCQSSALEKMLSLYTKLGKCQMSMQMEMDEQVKEEIERAIVELIETSKLQEKYAASLASSGGRLPVSEMLGEQHEIRDAVKTITDELYVIARKTLRISQEAFAELGVAIAAMEQTMTDIESRKTNDAARSAAIAPERINLAAIRLLEAAASSGSASSGGGKGMQQLSGGQSKIDDKMRDMLGGQGGSWSMEQRASMQRIAAEQRSMDELLRQILEEGGGEQQMLGDLGDIGGDMEEIARQLERGELDSELLEREERVLSRLLESQRSLNRRDYSRRRESRTGDDIRAVDPGTRVYTPDERNVLLERIRRAMRDAGPAEYEELNRLYFRALSGKARDDAMSRITAALLLFSLALSVPCAAGAQDGSLGGEARKLRASAIEAMTGGDYPAAIALFNEFNEKYPGRFEENYYLGKCYMAAGMFEDAALFLEGARVKFPGDYQFVDMLGQAYVEMGEQEKAVEAWHSVLTDKEKDASRYLQVSRAEWNAGMFDQAIETLKEGRRFKAHFSRFTAEIVRMEKTRGNYRGAFIEALPGFEVEVTPDTRTSLPRR